MRAFVVVVALLGLACPTACGAHGTRSTSSPTGVATDSVADVAVDPLAEVTDPADPRFVARRVVALLHRRGSGPTSIPISVPKHAKAVRVYVSCYPASDFQVSIGKGFKGACASRFQNFADIPLGAARRVNLVVPRSTTYWLLVIPTPPE